MNSIGTLLWTWWAGEPVGTDRFGNRYYREKNFRPRERGGGKFSRERRWVIYNGEVEASKVPPEWHGWLHHTFIEPPTVEPLLRRSWEKDHQPNLSGTIYAYKPRGSIARGGERQPATGDYEAWTPK
jgi:NADH:ubiquinone oxidoreductase subunit